MKALNLLPLLFLVGCSNGFEAMILTRSESPQKVANRVESINQNLTMSVNGVTVTDEMDPMLQFVYESKIAAPQSTENIYSGTIQATSVSLLPSNKMVIAYNTKTAVVEGGIDIVDITTLQTPSIIHSYVMPTMEFADSKYQNNKIYLSGVIEDQGAALVTVDVSNLSAPVVVDVRKISSYYGTSLSLQGNSLLVTTGDNGDVYGFILDSNGMPQQASQEHYDNLLFVQHYADGYVVLYDDAGKTKLGYKNLSTSAFSSMNLKNVHFESPARFDIHGNVAYVSTADEKDIIQVNLANMTQIHTIVTTGRGNGLKHDSGLLYTAQGEEGFKLFDVRDQYAPVYKGRFNFDDSPSANNIWTFTLPPKKVVVLADGLGGVKIISQKLASIPQNYCTHPTSVISYNPVGAIEANRKNTANVLGVPSGDIEGTINFTSLGKTGQIVVEFDIPIKNVPGPDLRVYEVSWNNLNYSQYKEEAEVYGSNDLVTWTHLGLVKNDNGNPALGQVDLGQMTQAKYIKLVDKSTQSGSDGFDVEGFSCMNQEHAPVCESTTNHIKNGSFEETSSSVGLVNGLPLTQVSSQGQRWDVFSQIPHWVTDSGSGIEMQAAGVSSTAQDGLLLVELDSHPNPTLGNSMNSKMSQMINLNVGNYKLKLYYKARNPTGTNSEMKVMFDDVVIKTVNILNNQWNMIEIPLYNISQGTHKVSLMGSGTEDGIGALVDNVSLKQMCLP